MLLSQIEQYWTGRAEGYSEVNRHELATGQDQVWFREIQKHLPKEKKLKILDVGTGPGFFAILLAGQGYDVQGNTAEIHAHNRRHKTDGNGKSYHQRRAQIFQEQNQD